MVSLMSLRQLKPGSYEDFRKAWMPDPWHPKLQRVEIFRNDDSPDQVLTVSYLDATVEDVEAMRDDPVVLEAEAHRLQRMAAFEEHVIASGIFVLVEEVLPPE